MKTKIIALSSLTIASALCLMAAREQEPSNSGPKKEWNPNSAVEAFTAALTKAGYDSGFRKLLTSSPDSARKAVSDEGKINIPQDIVVVFYEDKKEEREKHHSFYLPPLNETARTKYEYKTYFECCYNVW